MNKCIISFFYSSKYISKWINFVGTRKAYASLLVAKNYRNYLNPNFLSTLL